MRTQYDRTEEMGCSRYSTTTLRRCCSRQKTRSAIHRDPKPNSTLYPKFSFCALRPVLCERSLQLASRGPKLKLKVLVWLVFVIQWAVADIRDLWGLKFRMYALTFRV